MVKKQSKSEAIAAVIGNLIHRGIYPAGYRLPAVRELAAEHGMSCNSILAALDELEKNRLIVRKPRQGNFVEVSEARGPLEALLLIATGDGGLRPFARQLWTMSLPENLPSDINFTYRPFITNFARYRRNFVEELQQLMEAIHPDCILIAAPELEDDEIDACQKFGIPAIFLGDFLSERNTQVHFQISGDNFYGAYAAARSCIRQSGSNRIVCLSGPQKIRFFQESMEGFEFAANEFQVSKWSDEIPINLRIFPLDRREAYWAELGERIRQDGFAGAPMLMICGYPLDNDGELMRRHLPGDFWRSVPDTPAIRCFHRQIHRLIRFAVRHQDDVNRQVFAFPMVAERVLCPNEMEDMKDETN